MGWLQKLLGNRKNNFKVEMFSDEPDANWTATAQVSEVKEDSIKFIVHSIDTMGENKGKEFTATLKITTVAETPSDNSSSISNTETANN